jgi:hypothetical protein
MTTLSAAERDDLVSALATCVDHGYLWQSWADLFLATLDAAPSIDVEALREAFASAYTDDEVPWSERPRIEQVAAEYARLTESAPRREPRQEVRFIPQTCPACGVFIRVAQPQPLAQPAAPETELLRAWEVSGIVTDDVIRATQDAMQRAAENRTTSPVFVPYDDARQIAFSVIDAARAAIEAGDDR